MIHTPTLIIGAGPAGLAVAGRLRRLDQPFEIVEQSIEIATRWVHHYDRLCLHTVKEFSALPHKPLPADYPKYVPKDMLVTYFQEYAEELQIHPHFGQTVISVEKQGDHWITQTSQGKEFRSENVVVCTGFNRVPNIPQINGQDTFQGKIDHCQSYKNPKPYRGKKVLVVGMGNTGAEIALDLCEHEVETFLSVRGPVNIVPLEFMGNPTSVTSRRLKNLPPFVADFLGRFIQGIYYGNLEKHGLKRPDIPPAKQLRTRAKTPVLDLGTIARIKEGKIKVFPGIERLSEHTAHFTDGQSQEVDIILLATGYNPKVEGFIQKPDGVLDENGYPKFPSVEDEAYQGLYFVGFDAYSNGILDSIHRDSKKVVEAITSAP